MKATLPEVEGFVWDLLVAPEGVEKALRDFTKNGDPRVAKLEEWFQGDARLSAAGRLDIYANMYFFRLRDSLREDFPLTARVLGEDRFHNLVTDYLLVHPSTAPSLRWVGRALPEFLSSHPTSTRRPFLRDLAALEWARGDAFQADDVPPFDAGVLAALPPERWNDLVLVPVPSLHLVRVSHEVALLFERLTDLEPGEAGEVALEAATSDVAAREQAIAVFRMADDDVHHEVVAPHAARGVDAFLTRRPFGEICAAVAEEDEDADEAAQRAAALLSAWLENGLVASASVA